MTDPQTTNSEHNAHLAWFSHFMELFLFQIKGDVIREELEDALVRFRECKYGEH